MLGFYEEFDAGKQKEKNNIKSLDKALFESELIEEINLFIPNVEVCQGFFYYITACDNSILVNKKDYKLSSIDILEINIANLTDVEKEKAISLVYSLISYKLEPNKNNSYIKYIEERTSRKYNNIKHQEKVKSRIRHSA